MCSDGLCVDKSSSLTQRHSTTDDVLQATLTSTPVIGTPVMSCDDAGSEVTREVGKRYSVDVESCVLPAHSDVSRSSVDDVDSGGASDGVTQFTEQITCAKEGLVSAASRHVTAVQPSSCVADNNSETDEMWKHIAWRVSHQHVLKIRDLDFSDLMSADSSTTAPCSLLRDPVPTPPPPPSLMIPPPPPPLLGESTVPTPPLAMLSAPSKTRKTMKLHWKETKPDMRCQTIWTEMSREIGSVKIDCGKLEHLFETRTVDMKSKVCTTTILIYFVQLILTHLFHHHFDLLCPAHPHTSGPPPF